MKLAVISDIHGNIPALEAVLEDLEKWQPEKVIVNGDAINRGPYSLRVMEILDNYLADADKIQGNHETFVLSFHQNNEDVENDPLYDLKKFTHWSYLQLGKKVEELFSWHDKMTVMNKYAGDVQITHASLLGNRRGVMPESTDDEIVQKLTNAYPLNIISHTHRPFIRTINASTYVNTGSVGQPFDNDPRASYGRFVADKSGWLGEIRRVEYDKAQAEKDCIDSGFLELAGPIPQIIYRELRHSKVLLGPWMKRFAPLLHDGSISVENAVKQYLDEID